VLERVAGIITRYNMFPQGGRVGVAVSGGADSVCLLHLLHELAPRWGVSLSVLHLNHRLRGAASSEDAVFVRDLAGRLRLDFHLAEADVADICRETGDNLEQAARGVRLEFFRRAIQEGLADRVATGHTRSDQAETVLFRFLRGASTAGLAGVRPVTTDGLVRPLLEVERGEVEAWLQERGISWRQDATNRDLAFARNRIRLELLPELTRAWNPALPETLAHTADWALAEEDWWVSEMDRLAAEHLHIRPPAVLVQSDRLLALPLAVARRLVRRAMACAKGDLRSLNFGHVEAVLELARGSDGHGRLQVPGLDILRSFEWLRLVPPTTDNLAQRNFRLPLPVPGRVVLPGGETAICAELLDRRAATNPLHCVYNGSMEWLDRDRISGSVEVRNWRPGDQYRRAGHSSQEKIKQLFQQARVPLWERRQWPIVTSGDVILWARCFGPAAEYAANPDCSTVLAIRETACGGG
jgi:tRNA(Ile)-lysidine synthase